MTAPRCDVCDGAGLVGCADCGGDRRVLCGRCDGEGSHPCAECGRPKECRGCLGRGNATCGRCAGRGDHACDGCHGFGDLDAGAAWAARVAVEHTPAHVVRGLLLLAPRLDAGGLPRFRLDDGALPTGAALAEGHVRAEVRVEIAASDTAGINALWGMGFRRSEVTPHQARKHMVVFEWLGEGFEMPDRRAHAPGGST